jgi:transposase
MVDGGGVGAAGGAVLGVRGQSRGVGTANVLEMPGLWARAKRAEGESFGTVQAVAAAVRAGVEAVRDGEVSALRAARELGVAYRTAWKLFTVLRQALAKAERGQELLSSEVEADESYFGGRKRGRGAVGKTPVFGILERGGKVHVEVVPSVRASELRSLLVAKVKRGSLVSTDQFKGHDGLVAYDSRHERIDKTTRFATGRVYLNGIEGFWSFAKERLAKFHGMSVSHFPLYLKELQFRYNHRPNCFATMVQAVKAFVEDHD